MKRYSILRGGSALAAAVLVAGFASAASADMVLVENEGFTLRGGVNGALILISEPNSCYGKPPEDAASYCDYRYEDPQNRDIDWADGFVSVSVAGDWSVGNAGRLFGEANAFGSATRGAGDTFRITQNGADAAFDVYNVGWASGEALPGLGTDALKITVGAQRFSIGDGFVIHDGVGDWNTDSAFYTAPRRAFRQSAVARVNTGPLRLTGFLLGDGGVGRDYLRLSGVDATYVDDERGQVGVSYIRVRNDSPNKGDIWYIPTDTSETGLQGLATVSVRAQGHPLAGTGWSPVFLSGEYVKQSGSDKDIDANAWYGEIGYTFEDAPWSPYFGYRRMRFSHDYQKLYPGFTRNWGTWFYGEVFTNYFWHRNLQINMLQARAAPRDDLALTANFYDIDFVRPHANAMGDRNAAREFDLIADWTINANMGLSVISGISFPEDGLKRRGDFGTETATLLGLYAWFSL